ncbi:MAG: Na+/H+ antiporter NhaA [Dehalococcoidia bacterium]|nr:Na+/H+ antiporter NhaA [Dehalococcoidia bacterium]
MIVPVQTFIRTESFGGLLLLTAAIIAILWANSPWSSSYFDLWQAHVSLEAGPLTISEDLGHWVNDGLMAIFFFVVALEIKREFLYGELADRRRCALPIAAAAGGMVAPALFFLLFNGGGEGEGGWGIPMATDIAFALGVLALLGRRVPVELRVFLLTIAVVDDLGAIAIIAFFYTEDLALSSAGFVLAIIVAIVAMNRAGVRSYNAYVVVGVLLWVAVFKMGVHATVAGVVLGALTPSQRYSSSRGLLNAAPGLLRRFQSVMEKDDHDDSHAVLADLATLGEATESPMEHLERLVHPWSSYVVLPLFALANAGIVLSRQAIDDALRSPVTLGIVIGLLAGKVVGVSAATWLMVRLRLGSLPRNTEWTHIWGVSIIAGMGFSVSLFITGLAYEDDSLTSAARIGVLAASVIAGALGYAFLRLTSRV